MLSGCANADPNLGRSKAYASAHCADPLFSHKNLRGSSAVSRLTLVYTIISLELCITVVHILDVSIFINRLLLDEI